MLWSLGNFFFLILGKIRNDGRWSDISSVKLPDIHFSLNSFVKMLSII